MVDMAKTMRHPDIDADPVPVTDKAFKNVWSKKGWILVDADDDEEQVQVEDVDEPEVDVLDNDE